MEALAQRENPRWITDPPLQKGGSGVLRPAPPTPALCVRLMQKHLLERILHTGDPPLGSWRRWRLELSLRGASAISDDSAKPTGLVCVVTLPLVLAQALSWTPRPLAGMWTPHTCVHSYPVLSGFEQPSRVCPPKPTQILFGPDGGLHEQQRVNQGTCGQQPAECPVHLTACPRAVPQRYCCAECFSLSGQVFLMHAQKSAWSEEVEERSISVSLPSSFVREENQHSIQGFLTRPGEHGTVFSTSHPGSSASLRPSVDRSASDGHCPMEERTGQGGVGWLQGEGRGEAGPAWGFSPCSGAHCCPVTHAAVALALRWLHWVSRSTRLLERASALTWRPLREAFPE